MEFLCKVEDKLQDGNWEEAVAFLNELASSKNHREDELTQMRKTLVQSPKVALFLPGMHKTNTFWDQWGRIFNKNYMISFSQRNWIINENYAIL